MPQVRSAPRNPLVSASYKVMSDGSLTLLPESLFVTGIGST
jgi:hypothetical protein